MTTANNNVAIAAWESETVLNLGPVLDATAQDRLWTAILAHRESRDVSAFGETALDIAKAVTPEARARLEAAIATLNAIHAAQSAQE